MRKKTLFLLLTVFVIAYVVTAVNFWLVENMYAIAGRFMVYYNHLKFIRGEGPAPNQYRVAPYFLVEYVFKYSPVRWYCNTYRHLKRWCGYDESPLANLDNELNLESHFPTREREKFVKSLESFIRERMTELTKNPIVTGLVMNFANQIGWKEWFYDPFTFAHSLVESLPYEVRQVFYSDSELTKLINGYATMKFVFAFLLFFVLYLWLRSFENEMLAYFGLFCFAVFLIFSYADFTQQEFMISVFLFVFSMWLIRRNKPWWSIFLTIVAMCFVRTDHALFVALLYGLARFEKRLSSLIRILLHSAPPILMTYLWSKVIFPSSEYYTAFFRIDNFTDPWSLVYPAIFFALILVFINHMKSDEFFRRTWLWLIPFFILNATVGVLREIRLFLPAFAYLLPVFLKGVRSLYNTTEK
ncbi:MAG: hypothetical protein N2250_04925 [Pseudothermotoga sp.]|nr:hypothetical protein [Pseudothermotoga sp.]